MGTAHSGDPGSVSYVCLFVLAQIRLAGLIPPFIHSFLKMPYPETDGIRYFFAPRPGMRRTAHTKGDPWRHAAEIDLHLAEVLQ